MSALVLKAIACGAMLLDHIGFAADIDFLRLIGRIAFPIFLYLIYNGYRHTSSRLRYALRLGLFALISQVPFSLFQYGSVWSFHGNVFFTLLVCLLCIWAADSMRKDWKIKWLSMGPALGFFFLYHFGILRSDYGAGAVLASMAFLFLDGKKWYHQVLLTVAYICCIFYQPILAFCAGALQGNWNYMPELTAWKRAQICSVAAFPLIFSYNGEKGRVSGGKTMEKIVQYGFYAFYPIHMLALWLILG